MAFDITSVLKGAAGEAGREEIQYIDLDRIDPDPCNFYSLDGLDELAANIELIGLQQPLRVRPSKAEAGRYIIVSGHRRRAAMLMIRDGFDEGDPGHERWEKAACIVDYGEASDAMRELRLIYANAATRIMTSAEQSIQAERVTELLYQLKEQGVEFPGRMRDHVAEACQISKTKLARLHAIRANLCEGWLRYYDAGELPEETAYQISRLPAEIQTVFAEEYDVKQNRKPPVSYVVEEVNRYLERIKDPDGCPSHAGNPPCHWKTEKVVWSLFRTGSWEVCQTACCRMCGKAENCSGACQEAKDRAKLEKEARKEEEAKRWKEKEREQSGFRKRRKDQAKRLLSLIEAAGMKDDEEMPSQYDWNPGMKVAKIREAAAGEFSDSWFYEGSWSIVPDTCSQMKRWAEKLDCSADYLLGLSDEPRIAEKRAVSETDTGGGIRWQTGTPTEVGEYVVRAGVPAKEIAGSVIPTIRTWNGENWVDARGVPMRLNVYKWLKLPEE